MPPTQLMIFVIADMRGQDYRGGDHTSVNLCLTIIVGMDAHGIDMEWACQYPGVLHS